MASDTGTTIDAGVITGINTPGLSSVDTINTDSINSDSINSIDSLEIDTSLTTPSVQPLPADAPARTQIFGTEGPDIISGTPGDDEILAAGGDDIIFGTTGSDIINGGEGFDTVDYSQLTQAITLLPRGGLGAGSNTNSLIRIESIIAPSGLANTIDASTGTGEVSLFASLADRRLEVRDIPVIGTQVFDIQNFANVKSTPNADELIGDDNRNTFDGGAGKDLLEGRGGNDKLVGGEGEDRLIGASVVNTQAAEVDRLTGGTGGDRFVLAASSKSLYTAFGANDFALVLDYSAGDVIELGSQDRYSIQRTNNGFNVLVAGTETTPSELIAKVKTGSAVLAQTSGLVSGTTLLEALPTDTFQLAVGETVGGFVGV
jgi:Ca2+-binding RTX toxin-like protein